MLKRKLKISDVKEAREEAIHAFLDLFYRYDADKKLYQARSPAVDADFMESALDYIVLTGSTPTLSDLVVSEEVSC